LKGKRKKGGKSSELARYYEGKRAQEEGYLSLIAYGVGKGRGDKIILVNQPGNSSLGKGN